LRFITVDHSTGSSLTGKAFKLNQGVLGQQPVSKVQPYLQES